MKYKVEYDPNDGSDETEGEEQQRIPMVMLTKQESRWIAFGALKSALLIGCVYLLAGALLIWGLLALWA